MQGQAWGSPWSASREARLSHLGQSHDDVQEGYLMTSAPGCPLLEFPAPADTIQMPLSSMMTSSSAHLLFFHLSLTHGHPKATTLICLPHQSWLLLLPGMASPV